MLLLMLLRGDLVKLNHNFIGVLRMSIFNNRGVHWLI